MSDFRNSNGNQSNEENEKMVQTRFVSKRVAQDTDTIQQAEQPASRVRHRRSDRSYTEGTSEEEVLQSQQTAVYGRQVQSSFEPRKTAVPQNQEENGQRSAAPLRQPVDAPGFSRARPMPGNTAASQARRPNYNDPRSTMPRDHARAPEYDDYDEEDELPKKRRGRPWLTVLIILLLVLAAAIIGLMLWPQGDTGIVGTVNNFKQSLLGAAGNIQNAVVPDQKETAQALDFTVVPMQGQAPADVVFTLMTSKSVGGVRVADADGVPIKTLQSVAVNETAYIWSMTATLEDAFSGDVEAWIQDGEKWMSTGLTVHLEIAAPLSTPTPAMVMMATETPAPTIAPTLEPTVDPAVVAFVQPTVTVEPTATIQPTQAPTATPEPTPEPTATPQPTATPMPLLGAAAADSVAPSKLNLTDKIYYGTKSLTELTRNAEDKIKMPALDEYSADWPGGVLAFRNGPFRQNAAFGTADVQDEKMEILWQVPVGAISTYYGIGWTGQPVIVKWPKEIREMMNINAEKKAISALREVIISSQDGKVYFLDLKDGQPTRDTINIGYPLRGSVSLYPVATKPILSVGQAISKIGGKTGNIGNYLYNLLNQKQLLYTDGRDKNAIWSSGAFNGSALFDRTSDTMVIAGQNGLLYSIKLNSDFNYKEATLTAKPATTSFSSKTAKEKNNQVAVESSVAMYGAYAYYADQYGILRCVDTDTMTTVWAIDTGDSTDATIALDMENSNTVALYTANTLNRQGKKGVCTVRRLNALTGEEDWKVDVNCVYNEKISAGAMASPVVGENSISNLVIFTLAKTEEGGAVIAFDKTTGSIVWQQNMKDYSWSSPVAVYNEQGDAWIIQGDSAGVLHMLDGQTGSILSSLQLEGKIEASPAVYNDILVIGTSSKAASNIYGIQLR